MTPAEFSSAVSALDKHSDKLSHAISNLGTWLDVATTIVVVGLLMEAVEVAEYIEAQIKRVQRGRKIEWCKGVVIAGAMLVIVGVMGELAVQYRASSTESRRYVDERSIDRLRADEALAAEGKIADAKRDAANAIRDAARLGVTVKNLQGLVDTAQTKATEQSSALQKATVAFDNSISAANKEVADLEKSLLPRVFTFHVDDLRSLRAFANIPVFLSSPAGEPNDLLQELSVMFFPAIPFESKEPGNSVFMNGIEIRYPLDDEVSAQYALLVCQEIRKSHLEVSTHREDATSAFWDPKLPSRSLWIRVGARESFFSIKQREEEARAMTDPYAKKMFTSESGCGDEPLPPPPQ